MTPPVILGIDPGRSGALAFLDAATGHLIHIEDMPDATGAALGATIADLLSNEIVTTAHIEQVQSRPGQGHMNVWTFSGNYHAILASLGALGVPVEHTPTALWRKTNRIVVPAGPAGPAKTRAAKTLCRQKATELWPGQASLFKRVKDDGRAEAALIARHGWLTTRERAA